MKLKRWLAGTTAALVLGLTVLGGGFSFTAQAVQHDVDATTPIPDLVQSLAPNDVINITGAFDLALTVPVSGVTLKLNGYNVGGSITVDGNGGLTINGSGQVGTVASSGTVTINSGVSTGAVTVSGGTLRVNGGTVNGSVTVSGGKLYVSDGSINGILTKGATGNIALSGGYVQSYVGALTDANSRLINILVPGYTAYDYATVKAFTSAQLVQSTVSSPFIVRAAASTPITNKTNVSTTANSATLSTVITQSGAKSAFYEWRQQGTATWYPSTVTTLNGTATQATVTANLYGLKRGTNFEYRLVVIDGTGARFPESGIFTFSTSGSYTSSNDSRWYYDDYDSYDDAYYRQTSSTVSVNTDNQEMWKFWDSVKYNIQLAKEDGLQVVQVDAKTYDKIPTTVLQTLKGRDVWMTIDWTGGSTITINGKNMAKLDTRIYYPLATLAISYKNITLPQPPPVQTYTPTYDYGYTAPSVAATTPKVSSSSSSSTSSVVERPSSSSRAPSSSAPALPAILQATPQVQAPVASQAEPLPVVEPVTQQKQGLPIWAIGAMIGGAFVVVSGVVLLVLRKTGKI